MVIFFAQHGIETTFLSGTLCRIYKACFTFGDTPKNWKEIKVVFIPKPGKPNYRIKIVQTNKKNGQSKRKWLECLYRYDLQEFLYAKRLLKGAAKSAVDTCGVWARCKKFCNFDRFFETIISFQSKIYMQR